MAGKKSKSAGQIATSNSTTAKDGKLCLCRQKHPYKDCYTINPDIRPKDWQIKESVITRINAKLHNNASLRENILNLGYEYYVPRSGVKMPVASSTKPDPSTSGSKLHLQPNHSQVALNGHQTDLAPPLSLPKKPANPGLRLENLPTEILTEIVALAYQSILDEFPYLHPVVITGKPSEEEEIPPRRRKFRYSPERTVRRDWKPLFPIMYMSKQFYEICTHIRYREVHLGRNSLSWDRNAVCNRLLHSQSLQNCVKNLHFRLQHYYTDDYEYWSPFVKALASLPNLKHLCITIEVGDNDDIEIRLMFGGELLLMFFGLELETLTFIWLFHERDSTFIHIFGDWHNIQDPIYLPEYAPVPSKAEKYMLKERESWMRNIYKKSSWYRAVDDDEEITQNKPKHTLDWIATRRVRGQGCRGWLLDRDYSQWPMDRFTFVENPSACPLWNLRPVWNKWENPKQYANRMSAEALEASRPVLEWRKSFEPYKPNE